MSIGETLTQARGRVGLSITDVSERTRIRATIVRDIENNEFRSSGGDFYARGHIRAIARVVGEDPAPLIEAYDQSHDWSLRQEILRQGILGPDDGLDAAAQARGTEAAGPEDAAGAEDAASSEGTASSADGAAGPGSLTQPLDALSDAPADFPGGQAGMRDVLSPGWGTRRPPQIRLPAEQIAAFRARVLAAMAACVAALRRAWERLGAVDGTGAGRASAPEWPRARDWASAVRRGAAGLGPWAKDVRNKGLRNPRGRRFNLAAILGLALVAAVGAIAYLLAAGPATPARPATVGSPPRAQSAHRGHPAAGQSAPGPAAPKAEVLSPLAATAFGPGGAPVGDNPQLAGQALASQPNDAWHTSWYTTPSFGGLKRGTGLLLDMGKNVTITSAQLTLGQARGATLQLLAGDQPQMADLHPIAGASDAGRGSVVLRPAHPAQARYLLIWFTRLPPNNSGTYEAWVSNVNVKGLG